MIVDMPGHAPPRSKLALSPIEFYKQVLATIDKATNEQQISNKDLELKATTSKATKQAQIHLSPAAKMKPQEIPPDTQNH